MIIKIIMLLMGWTLAVGQPTDQVYHYIKVQAPDDKVDYYKTIGSATYAASDPSMYVDTGNNEAFVAWVHKSQAGTVMAPKLYSVTSVTNTMYSSIAISNTKVLDVAPRFERDGMKLNVCFSFTATKDGCWTRDFGQDTESWFFSGERNKTVFRTYLPTIPRTTE